MSEGVRTRGRTGAIGLLVLAAVLAAWLIVGLQPPENFATPRTVVVTRGASMLVVARSLAATGVVRSAGLFILYVIWRGDRARLKPGEYSFAGGESLDTVLAHLVSGDRRKKVVTIPEGLTIHQIAERLQQAGVVCASDFSAAALQGPIPSDLGLGALGAEGFLFPATYKFAPGASADQVLTVMIARFYDLMTPSVEARMFELQIDTRELVTMASIIEREAKMPAERPLIASVFYNRLAAEMPLQSDPTAQYNLSGEAARAVKAVHTASAFNTYTIRGLPPGPIANPGRSSIEAALYPAHTDYLYFVARDDGTHIFSHLFKDHQAAIRELAAARASSSERDPAVRHAAPADR